METVHEFDYKGYHCSITKDEYGFWSHATKDTNVIGDMFPEQTLDQEVIEIKRIIDAQIWTVSQSSAATGCNPV